MHGIFFLNVGGIFSRVLFWFLDVDLDGITGGGLSGRFASGGVSTKNIDLKKKGLIYIANAIKTYVLVF